MASGPSFRKNNEGELPTSNADIVPTILSIHNIAIPTTMNGRVMDELFAGRPRLKKLVAKKEHVETSVLYDKGTYTLTLQQSVLGNFRYIDFAKVTRTVK